MALDWFSYVILGKHRGSFLLVMLRSFLLWMSGTSAMVYLAHRSEGSFVFCEYYLVAKAVTWIMLLIYLLLYIMLIYGCMDHNYTASRPPSCSHLNFVLCTLWITWMSCNFLRFAWGISTKKSYFSPPPVDISTWTRVERFQWQQLTRSKLQWNRTSVDQSKNNIARNIPWESAWFSSQNNQSWWDPLAGGGFI